MGIYCLARRAGPHLMKVTLLPICHSKMHQTTFGKYLHSSGDQGISRRTQVCQTSPGDHDASLPLPKVWKALLLVCQSSLGELATAHPTSMLYFKQSFFTPNFLLFCLYYLVSCILSTHAKDTKSKFKIYNVLYKIGEINH